MTQPFPRLRHTLACAWLLAAMLVRIVYVPYHLAVEEHFETHVHAMAMDPEHHHAHDHAHDHQPEGSDHPPHSEEEHDFELVHSRTQFAKWVQGSAFIPAESEDVETRLRVVLVRSCEPGLVLATGPPRVLLGRGPPRAV